jgi:hypothetical protein
LGLFGFDKLLIPWIASESIKPTGKKKLQGHPIFFLSREKVRKNKIFKNSELETGPLFSNTSPSESVNGFLFGFDGSLANNEL